MASSSLGVRNRRVKLIVYVVAASVASMIGALIFITKLRISPEAVFNVNDWTVFVIFIVAIGGIGTIEGPIIGTILYFLLRELFADFWLHIFDNSWCNGHHRHAHRTQWHLGG